MIRALMIPLIKFECEVDCNFFSDGKYLIPSPESWRNVIS